jgi:Rrf2 family protein
MISKKAKYAIKALNVLAEEFGNGPMLIATISAQENIPKKFRESIVLELQNHGLLQSQNGKGGGYSLRHDCDDEETCSIRPIMICVRDANLSVYEKTTLRMFIEGAVPAV